MIELCLAAIFLLVTHVAISSSGLRMILIRNLGAAPYLIAHSITAFVAFGWIVSAYGRAPVIELWPSMAWQTWLALLIMPFACLLLVGGLTTANPTLVGRAFVKKTIEAPFGVLRITRHPTMWAFGLFAITHLIANGDAASLILFGTIALLALIGSGLIDARYRARFAQSWPAYAEGTSNVPLAAVIAGRQRLVPGELGWWRIAAALGLYGLLLSLHAPLFGVALLGAA